MKKVVYETGKKVYKRLPPELKQKALSASTNVLYKRHTQGVVVNQPAINWSAKNRIAFSIVIPSFNDYPLLTACIASVKETCAGHEYEIIVVDDYCKPENIARMESLNDDIVRVIFRNENGGFGKAVNTGMRQAKYDIILLNSDIVAKPGWIEALQHAAYALDDKIGLVSPKLIYPDGRIQYGGTYHARVLAPQWFGHLYVGRPADYPVANVAGYNRSISGACVYIKKTAIKKLDLLDEQFWLGFEDVDYGLRAWEKGIRCYYEPSAMLVHYESATRGYSQGPRELASMRHFWHRWNPSFMAALDEKASHVIDFVLSSESTKIWCEYVEIQASRLAKRGYKTSVHYVGEAGSVDESLVAKLSSKASLKVCSDWGAAETVWLTSIDSGKAVYLLPDIETVDYGADPQKQARIVAGYRPEFNYIAPTRWARDQLKAEVAWEAELLAPGTVATEQPATNSNRKKVIMVVGDAQTYADTKEALADYDYVVSHKEVTDIDTAAVTEMNTLNLTAIVYGDRGAGSSLVPLSLLSTAVPLVAYQNDKTRYEILDGYNALVVDGQNKPALQKALADIIENEQNAGELARNGVISAERAAKESTEQLATVLQRIAQSHI